jgi:predicted nucleic acid-binding protein
VLVLDSGAVTRLSERSPRALALIRALRAEGAWPPTIPTVVVVESVTGEGARDAAANRFLRTCELDEELTETQARRAALLRTRARRGSAISAVDAVVVAAAENGGTVLTSDPGDLNALAAHANDVAVVSL